MFSFVFVFGEIYIELNMNKIWTVGKWGNWTCFFFFYFHFNSWCIRMFNATVSSFCFELVSEKNIFLAFFEIQKFLRKQIQRQFIVILHGNLRRFYWFEIHEFHFFCMEPSMHWWRNFKLPVARQNLFKNAKKKFIEYIIYDCNISTKVFFARCEL